jgi:hypothetical protein
MSERFHSIRHACHKCKKPVVVQAAWDCPQSWIDQLCKLVVCNSCCDRHDAQNKAWLDTHQFGQERRKPEKPAPRIRTFGL